MAGRPRKRRTSSVSSAASVDRSHIRWTPESSILKPAPRDVPDSDWPIYVLTDATIFRKDGKTLANPLLVHVEGPLVVRGNLEVEDKDAGSLVRRTVRSAYIEIPHSDRYSIGDEPATLWVSGAAGWYEIRPSARYQRMYDQVREAIAVYYAPYVVYEEYNEACEDKTRRRPKPPTLDDIFLKYALKVGDGIVRDEVEALYHKWAEFLIAHFPKEDKVDWNRTSFAKWLRKAHPDVEKKMADIAKGLIPPPPPPPPPELDPGETIALETKRGRSTGASSRNSEVRGISSRHSRSPKPNLPILATSKTSETPIPLPEKYRHLSQSVSTKAPPVPVPTPRVTAVNTPDTPVDRLFSALEEVREEMDITRAAPSKVYSKIYFKCKVRQYNSCKDILAFYGKELLSRLGPEWKGTPFYAWFAHTAAQPWVPTEFTKAEDIPAQTARRRVNQKPALSTEPASHLPPTIRIKTTATKALRNGSDDDSDDDDVARGFTPQARSRTSGKAAGLRLMSSSKKRPFSDLDDETNGHRRGKKSAKTTPHSDDDEGLDSSADDSDADSSSSQLARLGSNAVGSRLPLPAGAVRVVVHAERLPTTSPSGPDGTWTCAQDGCSYVVRAADEQDAQALIQAHFRDHEAQAAKVDLAVKESRGGNMPINYLLDKIQALGKAAFGKRDTLNGEPVPAPVKRRLLI